MHPILLNFGPITIYTYGFFVALGFIAAITIAKREAVRQGENKDHLMDLAFYILIAAIIGARLFYVLTNMRIFLADPIEIIKIWNGGLVFYGGFITALLTALVYVKIMRMNLWRTADITAPAIALGHCIGRFGCFFAGCCYGKACDLPWAVTFNHPDSLARAVAGIPVHPTQLYSVLSNLLLFALLMVLRNYRKFEGQLFWIYVLLYGLTRSFIEIFRGDDRGMFVFDLFSVSQTLGISLAVVAAGMLFLLGKKSDTTREKVGKGKKK